MTNDLNQNELAVLAELIASGEGNGHDFIDLDEAFEHIDMTRHQFDGYLSSLSTKGYIDPWDDGEITNGLMTWGEKGCRMFSAKEYRIGTGE